MENKNEKRCFWGFNSRDSSWRSSEFLLNSSSCCFAAFSSFESVRDVRLREESEFEDVEGKMFDIFGKRSNRAKLR